jgi:hypothetical protein
MKDIKLRRISAGEYKTQDGRFYILNTYSSGGLPGRFNPSKSLPWIVKDESGAEPFYCSIKTSARKAIDSFSTLTEAKSEIKRILKTEEEEKQIQSAGYTRQENREKPGRCWKSPKTGELLIRSEALLEIAV